MHTTLAHEVHKAIIQERHQQARRPKLAPTLQQGPTHGRLTRRAVIAVILAVAIWTLAGTASALAAGSTLYVSSSASSDPACGLASQSNPFATIAGALACAGNGSTISI